MQQPRWQVFGLALIAAAATGIAAAAQSPRAQDGDVLNALLVEVRGLRQAMQDMASAGPRVQLALGRLQLQEQRLGAMIRRAETLRDAIASLERDNAEKGGQLAALENAFKGGNPTMSESDRGMLPEMLTSLKGSVAAGAAELQRLQAEEAYLQQQIGLEQGRWDQINGNLEELERALSRR